MFLRFPLILFLLASPVLGGCTSLDNIAGGISNAPDWFKERRVEIRGEGYPDLNTVPTAAPIAGSQSRLELSEKEAAQARETLFDNPRSASPQITPSEMKAWASRLHTELPQIEPKPEGFLSPAEIDALRAQIGDR